MLKHIPLILLAAFGPVLFMRIAELVLWHPWGNDERHAAKVFSMFASIVGTAFAVIRAIESEDNK